MPLHLHTTFSFLDGHGSISSYVKRAAELGLPAMATTDHGNVHNWLEFDEKVKAADIKPILGCEMYQARKTRFDQDDEERASSKAADALGQQHGPYHLTVLARNEVGYRNLIQLSSRSYLEGFYVKPRIDHNLLAEHAEGLIILSGCLNGEVQQALMRGDYDFARDSAAFMQDAVGREHYYIEVMQHGIPEQQEIWDDVLRIARELNAPIVATNDSHYVHRHEAAAHDVMLCVSTASMLNDEDRFRFQGDQFFLKSYDEMAELFVPEWLANTVRVAESVELDLQFGELHFPEFPLPEGAAIDTILEQDVWAGIARRYGDPPPQHIVERTRYELDVVKRMGFQGYFLVVADIVNWAKSHGIRVGPGRGSAAGSIMSYALGITGLEPLRFELMFERFLVEGRKSMPDIDLDFDDHARPLIADYIREKYGADRVSLIATFHQLGARQAIRDAARVLGYDYKKGDTTAKLTPPPVMGVSKSLAESLATSDMADAYRKDADIRRIVDAAKGLEGLNRQTGIHPAGVVISKGPTTEFVPVMRKSADDPIVCQWDMDAVEQAGQLKIDVLGLRNMRVIDYCLKLVKELRGEDIDIELVPYDDVATYRMLCDGHSQGVFQLESPNMRELMLGLQPDCIEDLMSLVSLYRPGPLGSGLDRIFVRRKHGRLDTEYDHPLLEPILKETWGTMLYQEQVLAVARVLAGFSPGEADDLRKAVGKKQMDKIPKFRKAFVEGAKQHNNVDPRVSNKIYDAIEYFGGYGFGRAHAASYALIAYWTAYLKCHYPVEYMAALLTSVDDKKGRMIPYLRECKRMGIRVKPPHLDLSEAEFKVVGENEILFGLQSIDGFGAAVVRRIFEVRDRPYTSFYDFFRHCPPDIMDKKIIERLVGSGSLDHLVHEGVTLTRSEKAAILETEKRYLSAYITEHPLSACWIFLEPQVTTNIEGLEPLPSGQSITVAGVMSQVQRKRSKKNNDAIYYTFELEDLTGRLEVVVFPKDAENLNPVEGEIVIVTGRLHRDGDEEKSITKLYYESIRRPELPEDLGGPPVRLRLNAPPDTALINKLNAIIEECPGDSPVYVEFPEGRHEVVFRFYETTSLEGENVLRMVTGA